MSKRLIAVLTLAVLVTGGDAFAQERPPRRERDKGGMRAPRNIRQAGLRDVDGLLEDMKETLRLSEGQLAELKKYAEDYKKELNNLRETKTSAGDSGKRMAEIREAMEKAREAQNQAEIERLLAEMRTLREKNEAEQAPLLAKAVALNQMFHDQLAARLGEKQKDLFEALWEDAISGKRRGSGPVNPRLLRAVVERVDGLSSEQKKQIDELFKEHEKAAKDTGGKRRPDARRLDQKLQSDVLAVLTKEQQDKVNAEIGKRDRNRDRAGAKTPPKP